MIEIRNFDATGEKLNKQREQENEVGDFWGQSPRGHLRLFPTTLRGLEKDHFCTYEDNGTWHFDT